MLFALVAVLCNTMPGPTLCVEEVVAQMPYNACTVQGQITLAQWMASGKYRDNWRLAQWKCEDKGYVVKGRV